MKTNHKDYFNYMPLRLLFVAFVVALAVYWSSFRSLPTHLLSHVAVVWIMALYRGLNKDKTSI